MFEEHASNFIQRNEDDNGEHRISSVPSDDDNFWADGLTGGKKYLKDKARELDQNLFPVKPDIEMFPYEKDTGESLSRSSDSQRSVPKDEGERMFEAMFQTDNSSGHDIEEVESREKICLDINALELMCKQSSDNTSEEERGIKKEYMEESPNEYQENSVIPTSVFNRFFQNPMQNAKVDNFFNPIQENEEEDFMFNSRRQHKAVISKQPIMSSSIVIDTKKLSKKTVLKNHFRALNNWILFQLPPKILNMVCSAHNELSENFLAFIEDLRSNCINFGIEQANRLWCGKNMRPEMTKEITTDYSPARMTSFGLIYQKLTKIYFKREAVARSFGKNVKKVQTEMIAAIPHISKSLQVIPNWISLELMISNTTAV
jgi:hypothetical protein